MRVLVTGGAGYVGSHAARYLAAQGHEILVYDNLSAGRREFLRFGGFCQGDLLDTELLSRTLRDFRAEAVLHFAAKIEVGESVLAPEIYYRNNIQGSLSLFQAMREAQIPRIVVSSSCAVYGIPGGIPKTMPVAGPCAQIPEPADSGADVSAGPGASQPQPALLNEDLPLNPVSPYGVTKQVMELMLQGFERAYGLSWLALRYFNAAGASQDGLLGELHEPETHLIPLAVRAALGRTKALTVFGTDYPTKDGSCLRDYVHVEDLASAHALGLDYLAQGGKSQALNLGTGQGASVLEVISAVERASGRKVPVNIGPRRPGDAVSLVADASLAKRLLGWKPTTSSLEQIVESAFAFLAQRG